MKLAFAIVLNFSVFLWGQSPAAPPTRITQVRNEAGWQIPGLKGATVKKGTTPHSSSQAKGFTYQVTVLTPSPQKKAYLVPLITADAVRQQILYREVEFSPDEIHRFEVMGKPYCYQVSGILHSRDPQTKAGGSAGTIDLLYYDESGDGSWTILDTGGLLLPEVPQPPLWTREK